MRRSQPLAANCTSAIRAPACVSVACAFQGPNAFESKQSLAPAVARGRCGNRNAAATPTRSPSARRRVLTTMLVDPDLKPSCLADNGGLAQTLATSRRAFAVQLPPINPHAEKRALLPRINPFATALR